MIKLIQKLNSLKEQKKELNESLKEELLKFPDYAEIYEEKREVNELLALNKKKIVEIAHEVGSIVQKIKNKQCEIKLIKDSINNSVTITSKDSGEVVQLNLF